jgi:hypothetical protein
MSMDAPKHGRTRPALALNAALISSRKNTERKAFAPIAPTRKAFVSFAGQNQTRRNVPNAFQRTLKQMKARPDNGNPYSKRWSFGAGPNDLHKRPRRYNHQAPSIDR